MSIAVTGIKPTGLPHLGNYLGMIKPALDLARDHEALYFIADYHALTAVRDGARVRDLTYELAATLLALGLDATRTALYRQSDVPQVGELAAAGRGEGGAREAHPGWGGSKEEQELR